jgi:E3 ubiquitin-protein ligase HUWE1
LALIHPWGNKEHGLDLLQLIDEKTIIPEALTELNFQFYRTISQSTDGSPAVPVTTSAGSNPTGSSENTQSITSSPTKQRRSSHSGTSSTITATTGPGYEGLVIIHALNISRFGSSDYEILAHFVKEYQIPEGHQFSLLNRIRVATGITEIQKRRQLLTIRMLGIAIMSHVLPEATVMDKFFGFEPEIIQSLADLIHPDHQTPYVIIYLVNFVL